MFEKGVAFHVRVVLLFLYFSALFSVMENKLHADFCRFVVHTNSLRVICSIKRKTKGTLFRHCSLSVRHFDLLFLRRSEWTRSSFGRYYFGVVVVFFFFFAPRIMAPAFVRELCLKGWPVICRDIGYNNERHPEMERISRAALPSDPTWTKVDCEEKRIFARKRACLFCVWLLLLLKLLCCCLVKVTLLLFPLYKAKGKTVVNTINAVFSTISQCITPAQEIPSH